MEIIDSSSDKIKIETPAPTSTTKRRLKIGITSQEIKDLFCNGLRFNNQLWYDFLTNCGYDVYFLTTTDYTHPNYRFKLL